MSKDEEETSLILEEANDLKPHLLKSGVEDISCSTETLPPATTEETDDTIIHEYDHEDVACDVTITDGEGLREKRKLRFYTEFMNRFDVSLLLIGSKKII